MEPQCPCCACNGFASFTKQHPLCIYGNRNASKTYLFFNKINNNLNKFTYDDLKLVEKISKEYKDEIDEYIDSEKSTVTPSETSCNGNLIDRPGKLFSLTCSCQTLTKSAAELNAQIMNDPIENLKNSMRQHFLFSRANISILIDIIEKMKEVCKACSCKACEYIVGKSQQNKICRCKPCECDDCNNFKKKITTSDSYRSIDVTQAGPDTLKVGRSLFKEFAKQELKQECNCKPCECADCAKCVFAPYNCEQCCYVESKARYKYNKYQNLGVAAIESNNQSRRGYMCTPCNCAQSNHHHGVTPNLCHEMSAGINRRLGCHCEICLNGACLPDGTDTCPCQKHHRLMRKPTQRDTDYDIHRSIVTQQNIRQIDSGGLDLVEMIAAISKVYPDYHSQVNECSCGLCECLCFYNRENTAHSLKTSNFISDINLIKHDDVKTLSLNHEFASRKSLLNITKATPCLKNLKRHPEIKKKSKCLSNNKCCRCSQCECIECDLVMSTSTDDVCDCERCLRMSKDDVIYPIQEEQKRVAAVFDTKINRSSYYDKENQNDDDYETPQKKASSSSSLREHYTNNLTKNYLVGLCDEDSHIELPNVEQQLFQKLITKLKINHHSEPCTNFTNMTLPINVYGHVKCQSSHSNLIAEYPTSNHIGSESNSQSDNKYETNSFDNSDSNYLNPFPKKISTYLSDINEVDKFGDIKHKKLNTLSKNTPDHLNVSSDFHNRYENKLLGISATSSRYIKYNNNGRKSNNLCYDKCCFIENDRFQSTNESSQCNIIGKNNSSDRLDITQTMKQNKVLASNMKENCKHAVHNSESIGKPHKNYNEIDSEEFDNVPNLTIRKNYDFDEYYARVQKTIKDARTFSLHLKKLLETYENANRDFENVFYNITHSNQTLQQVVRISQNVLREAKEALTTDNYSENVINTENYSDSATSKYSFDNVPTKESNADALFLKGKDHKKNIENRLNIHIESIQPSKSTHDMNMIRNYEENTVFIQNLSKTVVTEYLEKKNEKGNIEPKQKELSNGSVGSSSCNDDAIVKYTQDQFKTFSFSNVDDSGYHDKKLLPTIETNEPTSVLFQSGKTRNIRKQSKRYTKIVSNRRKLFVPKFAKCSITNKTSNDLVDQINENDEEDNEITTDGRKLLKTDSESVVDKSNLAESDDSSTTIKTTGIINKLELSRTKHQETVELTDDDVILVKPPLYAKQLNATETSARRTGREITVKEYHKQMEMGNKQAENPVKQTTSMRWKTNYAKDYQGPEKRPNINEALTRLHSEVKKLSEMPLLLQKYEAQHNIQRNENHDAKNVHTCESLKVSSLTVRKVSDRTILVKWQVPKVLENVQGYELLVNGRSTQKIEDNLCCESVVSSLPRAEILLTVRTMTKGPCCYSHSPSTTIVYKPTPT